MLEEENQERNVFMETFANEVVALLHEIENDDFEDWYYEDQDELWMMLPVTTPTVVCTAVAATETVIGVSTVPVDILRPVIQVRLGDFGAGYFRGGGEGCTFFCGPGGLCQGDPGGGYFRGGGCTIFCGRGGLCQGDPGGGYFRGGGLCMQARGLHKSSFPSVLSPT